MLLRTVEHWTRQAVAYARSSGRTILLFGSIAFLLCLGAYGGISSWNRASDDAAGVSMAAEPASQPTVPDARLSEAPAAPGGTEPRQRVRVSEQRTHGDWRHACLTRDDGVRTCSIVQNLLHRETRGLLLSWRIVGDGSSLTSILQTPKNVLLSSGLRIDAGLPEPVVLPYQSCNASHCVSIVQIPDDAADRMKNVPNLAVTMVLGSGQTLRLPISTKGLAAAIEDLRSGGGVR
jgi:invasion protein IalB